MGLEYVNRRGDRYYVLHGKTKAGETKYYCAKKSGENAVEQLPPEFEIREDPASALVTVRKARPSPIMPFERDLVARLARELSPAKHAIVDVEGESLVVYAPDSDPEETWQLIEELAGTSFNQQANFDWLIRTGGYSATFRFMLIDEDQRHYQVERWCFLGSIDGWFYLTNGDSLEALARTYLPHLGKQSFYDLM